MVAHHIVVQHKLNKHCIQFKKPFQLQREFLGNLQCCSSFTGNKIVSYIKAKGGPVTVSAIFPYSHIQIIFYAFKLTCKLKSYVSIPFTSTIGVRAGGARGAAAPPQSLGNSDFLGSTRKFGQSQFLKTSPCFWYYFEEINRFYFNLKSA